MNAQQFTQKTIEAIQTAQNIAQENQNQFILNLIVETCQTAYVFTDGILVVRGTGTDDHQKFIAFAGQNLSDFLIPFLFYFFACFRNRIGFANLVRCG